MNDAEKNLRMILKFDTGADGFLKMIMVLAVGALIVLVTGIYFLNMFLGEMRQIS